jgi:YidC/Oxa1 family membrane protein insertase
MDSKRFLLAVVLMVAVMVVTNILLGPPPTPAGEEITGDTTAIVTSPARRTAATPQLQPADSSASVAVANMPVRADTIVVRSSLYEYRISTRGAAIVGAALRSFKTLDPARKDEAVELAADSLPELFRYRLRVSTQDIDLSQLSFTANTPSVVELLDGEPARAIEFHAGGAGGANITITYTFIPDSYVIDARMSVTGTGSRAPQLYIGLPSRLGFNEVKPQEDQRFLALAVNGDQGVRTVKLSSVDKELVESGPLRWAAVRNKYFVAGLLTHPEAATPFGGVIIKPLDRELAADMYATLVPAVDGTFAFRYYIGPQEPQRLVALGNKFQDVNTFGLKFLRPIMRPLGHAIQWAIYGMHNALGITYGWVLILFGVIVRILMWPLNAKATRSQMKNMEMQPLMKELQAKYKNDPQRLQQEMLKLYKEKGFNPMGGCLPMLAPMPILFAMFYVLQSAIAFRGVPFLWLPDLSQRDPFFILPVVLGVSMFITQWLSMRNMADQNPQMKMMMYIMPPMMTFMFMNFASGLNLYYAAQNIASIPQTLQIAKERARMQPRPAPTPAPATGRRLS